MDITPVICFYFCFCRQLKKGEKKASRESPVGDEEENYPGHGLYANGTLSTSKNNMDSVSSKVHLYNREHHS